MGRQIEDKFVMDRIKKGWTTEQFAQHYELSEEEFREKLRATFSGRGSNWMLSQIKINDKSMKKNKRRSASRKYHKNPKLEETPVQVLEVEVKQDEENPADSDDVEVLKALEKELKYALNSLELEKKEVISRRGEIKNKILKCKEELAQIQNQIKKIKLFLSSRIQEFDESYAAMQDLNVRIKAKREELETVSEKIKVLEKVSLFVYEAGTIESEPPLNFELPDWNDLFEDLTRYEEVEDLSIRQIRALAKSIALKKELKDREQLYEFSFENSAVEKVFMELN